MINNGQGYSQPFDLTSVGSSFNMNALQIWSILARVSTSTIVQVVSVDTDAMTVDMLPLVNMVDSNGNSFKHQAIYGCPYFQLQSGISAVVMPPTVGDIGIALFASRDTSSVIANKAQSNPGSGRLFDMSDGMYLGGILNPAPTQTVTFSGAGININTNQTITINGQTAVDIVDSLHSTNLEQMHDVFAALTTYINAHTHTYTLNTGSAYVDRLTTAPENPVDTPDPFSGGNIVT